MRPTAVSATSNANASSPVSWTAPSANGGATITSYTATSSPGGSTCSSATTSYRDRADQRHHLHLHGDRHQRRRHRAASVASSSAIPATTPGAPTVVTATPYVNTASAVSWTAPASNGGVDHHRVHGNLVCRARPRNLHHRHHRCTVTGLTNGTAVHVHGGRHQRRRHRCGQSTASTCRHPGD